MRTLELRLYVALVAQMNTKATLLLVASRAFRTLPAILLIQVVGFRTFWKEKNKLEKVLATIIPLSSPHAFIYGIVGNKKAETERSKIY